MADVEYKEKLYELECRYVKDGLSTFGEAQLGGQHITQLFISKLCFLFLLLFQ
jgi:hypothetical protein